MSSTSKSLKGDDFARILRQTLGDIENGRRVVKVVEVVEVVEVGPT